MNYYPYILYPEARQIHLYVVKVNELILSTGDLSQCTNTGMRVYMTNTFKL